MTSIKLSVSKVNIREYIETCMKSFIFYKQKENIICILFCTIKLDVFISICILDSVLQMYRENKLRA